MVVVTWPLSGMCTSTRARNASGSTVSLPAVGASDVSDLRHRLGGSVVGQPLQRDGIPRTIPGEPSGKRPVLLGHPDGRVHVEPRVRPGEYASGLVLFEEIKADEEAEYGTAKRLGQACRVVRGPRHESPIRPEAAVGDEQVPVRAGAVRLQAGDDADGEVALARQRANGGGDGSGGDAGDLAE